MHLAAAVNTAISGEAHTETYNDCNCRHGFLFGIRFEYSIAPFLYILCLTVVIIVSRAELYQL